MREQDMYRLSRGVQRASKQGGDRTPTFARRYLAQEEYSLLILWALMHQHSVLSTWSVHLFIMPSLEHFCRRRAFIFRSGVILSIKLSKRGSVQLCGRHLRRRAWTSLMSMLSQPQVSLGRTSRPPDPTRTILSSSSPTRDSRKCVRPIQRIFCRIEARYSGARIIWRMHGDRAQEVTGALVSTWANARGVHVTRTVAKNPQTNGIAERGNRHLEARS